MEKDIFEEFKKRGVMSREAAAAYRQDILAPGGSQDASDLVRKFLGRDYDFVAFEKWLDRANVDS
jgi:thimet oligopeptidase